MLHLHGVRTEPKPKDLQRDIAGNCMKHLPVTVIAGGNRRKQCR